MEFDVLQNAAFKHWVTQDRGAVARNRGRLLAAVLVLLPAALHAQPEVEIEFISSFGSMGTALGEFDSFGGVTVDNAGLIYITDNDNHRIQICDYQGNCEADGEFGSFPAPAGQFQFPIGIALDQTGRIVVSDGQNMRIQIRDLQGAWSTFGTGGNGIGEFRIPAGVAIDSENRIVIADENNGRVQRCNDQGNCEVIVDGLPEPRAVGFDSQGRVVISDRVSNRISICVPNGACTDFGGTGSAPGQFNVQTEVWVDERDLIYVSDRDNNRFQICDLDGGCLAFGQFGNGPGQFDSPTAIAVDDQDRIIVGDSENDRIQIFQATFPEGPGFTINSGLNDSWYNPATSGQGFFLTVFEDIGMMFLAWFTYDTERPAEDVESILGEPGHRWLTAFGPYDGETAVLEIELTRGGVFNMADPVPVQEPDGTITLEFSDCNAALVSYDILSADAQGEIPIERIAADNIGLCQSQAGLQ
jgi:DNA-binding beta-propeller fold protein YncE